MSIPVDFSPTAINFAGVPPDTDGPNINVDPSFGPPAISFAGGIEITEAPSDDTVSAHIEDDAAGIYRIRDLILMEWTLEPVDPGELPPGHHGPLPKVKVLEIVRQADGATSMPVTKGQYLLVRVAYKSPGAQGSPNDLTAMAVIQGSVWEPIRVKLSLHLAAVTASFSAPPLVIVQGQKASTPITISSIAGPHTDVSFEMSRTQLHTGISLQPNSFPLDPGQTLLEQLYFTADADAPLGENTLAIDRLAVNQRHGMLLAANILAPAPPPGPGPDPQRIDPFDVVWMPGSTKRICQLTGGGDPTGLPHVNDTTRFDLLGTDLGSSFDHWIASERRTYFFFGDSKDSDHNEGDFGDAIAYTVDDNPEPDGVHLRFVMGDNNWRRLVIPGVDLGKFAVPTGGFSHAGRLFVFATTDCDPDNRPFGRAMGRSVLASATDPSGNFEKHYEVSNNIDDWIENGTGGGKFINVSPYKVNNDDWRGLPENAVAGGEGLLLMASGKYRNSAPYMAYVPLTAGRVPEKSEWRYLRGWLFWEPGFGPNGPPDWSDSETEAIPVFKEDTIGELSFCWNGYLKRWLVLYGSGPGILLRSAGWPWGPWSADPQVIFNSQRDHAQDQYMFECGSYGAYVVSRYDEWDSRAMQATIYYTLSNGDCWKPTGHDGDPPSTRYQVHLMKSALELLRKA